MAWALRKRELRAARRSIRFPTRIDAIVVSNRKRLAVFIADISRFGARLSGERLPEPGSTVVVTTNGLEIDGTIVWVDRNVCGVSFHDAIEPLAVVRANPFLPDLDGRVRTAAPA